MTRFLKLIDRINEFVGRVFCWILALIMLLVSYEVFKRYVLTDPTIWVWEVNYHLMCVMGALSGGIALLYKKHINVDILYGKLSVRHKAILDIRDMYLFLFYGRCTGLVWLPGGHSGLRETSKDHLRAGFTSLAHEVHHRHRWSTDLASGHCQTHSGYPDCRR